MHLWPYILAPPTRNVTSERLGLLTRLSYYAARMLLSTIPSLPKVSILCISVFTSFLLKAAQVKDWDQLNFTVFTMSCEHSYSNVTVISGSSTFDVANDTSFSPAHQTATATPPFSWKHFSHHGPARRGTSRPWMS